jgi:hypothetical protein
VLALIAQLPSAREAAAGPLVCGFTFAALLVDCTWQLCARLPNLGPALSTSCRPSAWAPAQPFCCCVDCNHQLAGELEWIVGQTVQ